MIAARRFLREAVANGVFQYIAEVTVELFGSLALTGRGHATDRAVLFGLLGEEPDSIDVESAALRIGMIRRCGHLSLLGRRSIDFDERTHLLFHRKDTLLLHPNGMRFSARDALGVIVYRRDYFSVGGGFVLAEDEAYTPSGEAIGLPYS